MKGSGDAFEEAKLAHVSIRRHVVGLLKLVAIKEVKGEGFPEVGTNLRHI